MGITGDFASLKRMIAQVGGLKTASARVGVAAVPKIEALVLAEFAAGADPYGEGWKPLQSGGKPFAGSGAAGLVTVKLADGGKVIRATATHPMNFHQTGTKSHGRKSLRDLRKKLKKQLGTKSRKELEPHVKAAVAKAGGRQERMPARPILPDTDKGAPPAWQHALFEAARGVMAAGGATPAGGA